MLFLFGVEIEFYLLNYTQDSLTSLVHELTQNCPFISEFKKENECDQFEVTFSIFSDINDISYKSRYFWSILHNLATKYKIELIKSAKPFTNKATNSMQISLSLHNNKFENLLNTPEIQAKIASILCHNIPKNLDIFAPTLNCKERLSSLDLAQKYLNIPYYISWGYNNRTVAIRLCKNQNLEPQSLITHPETALNKSTYKGQKITGYRIEHRIPSNIADLELCICLIKKDIEENIGKKIDIMQPIYGNTYENRDLKPILRPV